LVLQISSSSLLPLHTNFPSFLCVSLKDRPISKP
jgi:hypothetical protein